MPYHVNVDCANIYLEDKYRCPIVTQAVLWERVAMLNPGVQFSKIKCEDGYEGWINTGQIIESEVPVGLKMVTGVLPHIYLDNNFESQIIRNAGVGCYLPILNETDGWCEILLPDGQKGWVESSIFKSITGNPREIVNMLAESFLGIAYFWGGKTSKGLDCSGYVQLLHKMAGIKIRRNSPMQFEDAKMVGENILDGQAGDLLFFAEEGNKITHVAVKLANSKIIHARGMVKINSLEKGHRLYDESLEKDFIAVKTFL